MFGLCLVTLIEKVTADTAKFCGKFKNRDVIRNNFSSYGHEVCLMTLSFKINLDMEKMNQHAKCLHKRLFNSKVIVMKHMHTHTHPKALPGPLKWSVTMIKDMMS